MVDLTVASQSQGVVVGGTTGEGHLMSWDEQIMLTAHTVNNYGTHLHVIGNTGSNSTREAVHATQQGFAVGMHAALQINPYYGKTSHTGLIHHFNAVMEEGPAIIYNVPGRTGQDIPLHVIEKVAKHPNFAGVKECTGNDRIKLYTGEHIHSIFEPNICIYLYNIGLQALDAKVLSIMDLKNRKVLLKVDTSI